MMRSLLSAVSGMRNHQVRMDVIGNNVANVNTTAYKAGRATFKESFSQLVQSASAPVGDLGGINPKQVGTGMELGSVDNIFTQGNFDSTGVKTDMMVQGSAFFVVAQGNQQLYTRAGNFQIDAEGFLVHPSNGYKLQGRTATDGVLDGAVGDLRIPYGMKSAPHATSQLSIVGNLNAEAEIGDAASASRTVYDALGAKHELELTFTKSSLTTWDYAVSSPTAAITSGAAGVAEFNADGTLNLGGTTSFPDIALDPSATTGAGTFTVNPFEGAGDINGLTQLRGSSTPILRDQDGYAMGDLVDYAIDQFGVITGSFTNGRTLTLGQVMLADFNNPSGMLRQGENMYTNSANSGDAVLNFAGEGSQSSISSGGLEMSNVDLAQEFTRMIVTQRGFQAAGRVITSSDEMLQEVVNLKR